MAAAGFDSGPLLEVASCRLLEAGEPPTCKAIAGLLHVTTRSVARWRAGGRVRATIADRLAVQGLRVHPANLWPDWYRR